MAHTSGQGTPLTVSDFSAPSALGTLRGRQWTPQSNSPSLAPLVIFHDSLGMVTLWRDFPERLALATGRAVIAYDRLGFGLSDAHPGHLENDFITQEADQGFRAVYDALQLTDFIALGHSVGGGMAAGVAAAFPDHCQALITIAAQAFVEDLTTNGIRDAREGFQNPDQLQRLARYHGDKARWVVDAWTETWLAPAFAEWTIDATLANVRCPALILHGAKDEFGSRKHPERYARHIQGETTLVWMEAAGHNPHRETPEPTVAQIAEWLHALPTR